MRRRTHALVLALALAGGILAGGEPGAHPGQARSPVSPPSFHLFPTAAHGPEVTLGITSAGVIFFGGWDHVARSADGGRSWLAKSPPTPLAADRVLIVDRTTDRVFVDDTDLACTVLSWSDDLGETWTTNPLACGGGLTDHQKIAVGRRTALADPTGALYPNVVYVCANSLTHTPCAASVDGGRSFGPGVPAGAVEPAAGRATPTCAFQGVPVAGPDGTLYQPRTQCGAAVDRSPDNGLTWERHLVLTGPLTASHDAPDLAVAPDGTLYFFFTSKDWRPWLVRSTDGGRTWSSPVPVAPGVRSALFPVVAAGDDGRIGLAFYAATDDVPGWDGNPGKAPESVRWHLWAAVVADVAASSPAITPVRVTPDPVQIGCLSKLGSCSAGNIADYIDAEVGPDGRLHIAYVDGCPANCDEAHESRANEGWVAIQTDGPGG